MSTKTNRKKCLIIVAAFLCSAGSNAKTSFASGALENVAVSVASLSLGAGDTWTAKTRMPTMRSILSASTVDGKIYAIGGKGGSSAVEEYDPATDTWTKKSSLPTPRQWLSTSVVNGKIYAIGGDARDGAPSLSTVEVYDPATDTWTEKAPMLISRFGLSTSVVDGKIYAIGGWRRPPTSLPRDIEVYDPATDTWTKKAPMLTARAALSTSVVDGKIYAIGGALSGGSGGLSTVEVYDPATDTWTTRTRMPTPRATFLATSVVNGIIYVIGGVSGQTAFSTVEAYDPATDTWTEKTSMSGARWGLATSVVGGKIYAIGGRTSAHGATLSMVEEYDTGLIFASLDYVLVQGSQLHGANGVFFDSDDRLYIACGFGQEIVVMDKETGEILDRLGPDVGVKGPDDLTFGPDGSLYWTDIGVGEVGRLSPDGVTTKQFVAPGVNPITFSDDGRLFTALCFLGDALYELDPDLVDPPRLIVEGPGMLNAFDFGPDGFLYSPTIALSQVVRINVDTGEVTTLVEELLSSSMKFDSQGNLHVVSPLTGEILRVDTEIGSTEVIAALTFGPDNLAFDSQDRLFVSEGGSGTIFEVLPDGTTRAVNSGGMIVPGGVAVLPRPDGSESVFVADMFSLREFDGSTGEVMSIEHAIPLPGGIARALTVSPDGSNLLLSSWFLGNIVQVWNPETHEIMEEHLDFALPLNAIRFQGDLVVAELGMEEGTARVVQAWAADLAQRITLAEGLGVPAGLAATDDDLWVGDWAAGVVLQLVADGQRLAEPIPVATDLASPEGLAVAPDGNLLVVEAGAGRLSSINLETGEVSTVAEGLDLGLEDPASPPTYVFSGVAVGPSGTIYITSDINSQLLAIAPPEPEGE